MSFKNVISLCMCMSLGIMSHGAEFITIGTGGVTGVYYPSGGAMAKIVNQATRRKVRMSVESTGGSVFNINSVLSGNLNLGIAQSDRQYEAIHGLAEWKGRPKKNLRFLFSLHPEIVTLVAADDAGIRSIADLKGKVVNLGNPGSGQRFNAIQILKAAGINWRKDIKAEGLKAAECAKMLQDGRIDAYFYTVGHPAGAFKEVSAGARKVRIVPISGAGIDSLIKSRPFFASASIPVKDYYPGMVNDTKPVSSIGVVTTVVTSSTEKTDTMYSITKAIFSNLNKLRRLHPALANLKPEAMAVDGRSAPYHPGALKYFREAKLLKN